MCILHAQTIFTGDDGGVDIPTDVIIYPKCSHALQELSIYSPNCDSLCFPLLFPSGEPGWEPNLQHNPEFATETRNTVTCLEFSIYRWADRGDFNVLHHAGLLAQHKIVDDYVRVEAHRLHHQRQRQSELRVSCLNGLYDHVHANTDSVPIPDDPGCPVILPSSFQGSARNMSKNYQDSLAICRHLDNKADLFITFTTNTHWNEITSQLKPGQTPDDRPDLLARVFRRMLMEFMDDITKRFVLGQVAGYIYAIEFHKRGYAHAHMVTHFSEDDR